MNGKLETRSAMDRITSSRASKKGGRIADSRYINETEALCPKCDLMSALLTKRTQF
jgi:hypothetical protein